MRSMLFATVLLIWLTMGKCHPARVASNRLIIGTLVRLRRAAPADVKTTDQPKTSPVTTQIDTTDKSTTKEADNLSVLDNKILLLMIVPPDSVKGNIVGKTKSKKRLHGGQMVVSRVRTSKTQCASELTKKLEIAENVARQLLSNSSMALLASLAETKNAGPLVNKLSDAIDTKIKYVSDVKPVITCDDSSESTSKDTSPSVSTANTTTTSSSNSTTPASITAETSTVVVTTSSDAETTVTVKTCPDARANKKPLVPNGKKPSKIQLVTL